MNNILNHMSGMNQRLEHLTPEKGRAATIIAQFSVLVGRLMQRDGEPTASKTR
jgi:hypothetical protein